MVNRLLILVFAFGVAMSMRAAEYMDADTLTADAWAQVRVPVACVRATPGHSGELVTQCVMGAPVKLILKSGQWFYAELSDGYRGWIVDNSLSERTEEQLRQWRDSDRVIVSALYPTSIWASPLGDSPRERVSDALNGMILSVVPQAGSPRMLVELPDGRRGWIDGSDVTDLRQWSERPFDADAILDYAYAMEGSAYLWGGTSQKDVDCSGLSQTAYYTNGILLLRDASQQARTGKRLDADKWRDYRPGDLLFFGNPETGRVTHVAIYDAAGNYVHSSGRVKRNSLDPLSDEYLPINFLHAVRIDGYEGTDGIVRMSEHPWYFNK